MRRVFGVLGCAGIVFGAVHVSADDIYRLCGQGATGFIAIGRNVSCIRGATGQTPKPAPAKRNPAEPWIPEGFEKYNETVAFRNAGSAPCRVGGGSCQALEVVSKKGCQDLYVEAAKLGADGSNVGYTNDSTAGVLPGQIAKLELRATGELLINKINCR